MARYPCGPFSSRLPANRAQADRFFYGSAQFSYDRANDLYRCPQGQPLRLFCRSECREQVGYRANPATCNACPVKAKCTESDSGRQLHRSFYADYLERVKGFIRPSPTRKP
ncbi:MAG: transposase [Ktedonobacteraceae bacterium]|nr:transposase [Ktedonobacteraceae bacterium]